MAEPHDFPLFPNEVRFLKAMERWKNYVAPIPKPVDHTPPPPTPASIAAGRILDKMIRRPGRWKAPQSQFWKAAAFYLSYAIAFALIPVLLFSLRINDPRLGGWMLRSRLPTPAQVFRRIRRLQRNRIYDFSGIDE